MDDRDIAWAAGLFEGEGSFYLKKCSPGSSAERNVPHARIAMTDEDVIRRVHSAVGFGTVYLDRHSEKSGGKIMYVWHSSDRARVPALLMTLYSYLGERRRAKVREVLDGWRPYGYTAQSVRPGMSLSRICPKCGGPKDKQAAGCRNCRFAPVVIYG